MPRLSTTRLTTALVKAVRPKAARYDIADATLRGLSLRVYPNGKKAFCVRYRHEGRPRRLVIGAVGTVTLDEARSAARKLLSQAAQGLDPAELKRAARAAPTLRDAIERYMAEHVAKYCKPRTAENYEILVRRHLPSKLLRKKLKNISRSDIESLHREIGEAHRTTANRVTTFLSAVFNKAAAWGLVPRNLNPCLGTSKYRENRKERFLSPAERVRLEAALAAGESTPNRQPGHVGAGAAAAIRLLSLTGARLSEILDLRWAMVDWDHRLLRLPDSKTGAKTIPLSKPALRILRQRWEQRRSHEGYVCAGERGGRLQNIQRTWRAIRAAAELPDLRIHDLRHSAASDALMGGVPLALVGAMLGHRSVQTTQRYAHIADSVLRDAVEKAGEVIDRGSRHGARVLPIKKGRIA